MLFSRMFTLLFLAREDTRVRYNTSSVITKQTAIPTGFAQFWILSNHLFSHIKHNKPYCRSYAFFV